MRTLRHRKLEYLPKVALSACRLSGRVRQSLCFHDLTSSRSNSISEFVKCHPDLVIYIYQKARELSLRRSGSWKGLRATLLPHVTSIAQATVSSLTCRPGDRGQSTRHRSQEGHAVQQGGRRSVDGHQRSRCPGFPERG